MKSFWVEFIQPGSLTRLTELHIDSLDHLSFAYVRLSSQQVTELHIDPIDHPSFAYARLRSQQVTESWLITLLFTWSGELGNFWS